MPHILLVMLGGAIGAGARYQTGKLMLRLLGSAWPWATLTVNIAGGLVMGLFAGWLAARAQGGEALRLFFAVGVLGGFTTFSAFSLELILMLERGELLSAFGYALISVAASAAALMLGLAIMRVVAW